MFRKISFYTLSIIFILSAFDSLLSAQTAQAVEIRKRTYDVQNYIIRTKFDRVNKMIYGDTTVQLKPLKENFQTLELDAADMKFESVKLGSTQTDLNYKVAGEKIIVALDKLYSTTDLISVQFKYSAKPKKGVYFVDALQEEGKITRHAQVWTQGEAEEAHHWFPSYDFPDDKATSEQFITVEKNETAIANGELLETVENPDGTKTFHFKMPLAHSSYLTSFVVGTYAKTSDSYKNIPLGFYVYTDRPEVATLAFGKTKDMIRVYEELTGISFPYNKYDQTIVADFNFGGMENITATTMADSEIFFATTGFGKDIVTDLVSHELAHSWFGDLVTCKNWSELWLNESFATYMEAAYREKINGRADYLRAIKEDASQFIVANTIRNNPRGVFFANAKGDDALFDPGNAVITYQKGGAVIHMLRETVGTENFWKAINLYLNRHKFDNVETADLQKAMEETSGMNLDWFFKQWIYGAGFPKLSVGQSYNPKTKTLNLTVTQMQKADKLTPSAFILPMDIEIKTAAGIKTEKIEIKKRIESFSFKVDGKPTKILLDKDEKIPLKSVKMQTINLSKS